MSLKNRDGGRFFFSERDSSLFEIKYDTNMYDSIVCILFMNYITI